MFYILVALLVSVLIYGPHLWVRVVLSRYSTEIPGLPGTGGELAWHLLNRFQFDTVKVEQSEPDNNHYSPSDNAVRLSPDVYNGKSLTAVAVAAHEVGHAIQFNREEPVIDRTLCSCGIALVRNACSGPSQSDRKYSNGNR